MEPLAVNSSQVIVVGGGPAGLTAALALARQGVRCRVVDRGSGGRTGTGCHMLWPRTLEALDGAGLDVPGLVRRGVTVDRKVFHLRDRSFSHGLTDPASLWPLPLSVEQEVLEEALTWALERLGVRVERGVEARDMTVGEGGVRVRLSGADGAEETTADWLLLARGDAAGLREPPWFDWHAEPPPPGQIVHVDVELPGRRLEPGTEHIFLGRGGSVGLVPLPGGRHRLFAVLGSVGGGAGGVAGGADGGAAGGAEGGPSPVLRDVAETVRELTGIGDGITDLGGGWRFVPRHLIARSFRYGRCLLVGESAKSAPMPVHGMNGGVQDAFNLAWKLGAVLRGEIGPWLLDTYSAERRAVAEDAFAQARRILAYGTAADADATHGERIRRRRHDVKTEPPMRYPSGPLTQDGSLTGPVTRGGSLTGSLMRDEPDAPGPVTGALMRDEPDAPGPVTGAFMRDEPDAPRPRAGEHLPEVLLVTAAGTPTTLLREVIGRYGWTLVVLSASTDSPLPSPAPAPSAASGSAPAPSPAPGPGPAPQPALAPGVVAAVRDLDTAVPGLRTIVIRPGPVSPEAGDPGDPGRAAPVIPGGDDLRDPGGAAFRVLGAAGPAVYLVRPDGYIGYTGPLADLGALWSYVRRVFHPGAGRDVVAASARRGGSHR